MMGMTTNYETEKALYTAFLKDLRLVAGVGNLKAGEACTESALQLALTGKLTDDRHPCVDPLIHKWVMNVQDRLDNATLNGPWKDIAPMVVGTIDVPDSLNRIMTTMWDALSEMTFASAKVNVAWKDMLTARTATACKAAADAATGHRAITYCDFGPWAVRSLKFICEVS